MKTTELTTEQKFSLRSFEVQVEKMSLEQAQEFLVKLFEQMMMRETMYKQFLKHEWGIPDKSPIGTDGMYSGPINNEGG